jgi:chloride channel 3/4/5
LRDDVDGDADVRINGIRVWYSSFTSIDWLHDAIKDSVRFARLRRRRSIRAKIKLLFDRGIGWLIVTLVGLCTAVVAFLIVRSEQWLFDLKGGYCAAAWYKSKSFCCFRTETAGSIDLEGLREIEESCPSWRTWSEVFSQEGRASGVVEYLSYTSIAVSLCCTTSRFGTDI